MYFLQITKGSRTLVTSCPMSTVHGIIRINIFLDYYKRHGSGYILRNRPGPPDKRELFHGLCLPKRWRGCQPLSANCCWKQRWGWAAGREYLTLSIPNTTLILPHSLLYTQIFDLQLQKVHLYIDHSCRFKIPFSFIFPFIGLYPFLH